MKMSDMDEIKINVVIAERNFRLTINKADEEKVMKAAEMYVRMRPSASSSSPATS